MTRLDREKEREQILKEIEYGGEIEVPKEIAEKTERLMREAEEEFEGPCRVNFRWGRTQLALVKQAADRIGMPYQAYIKYVVYQAALRDAGEYKEQPNLPQPVLSVNEPKARYGSAAKPQKPRGKSDRKKRKSKR